MSSTADRDFTKIVSREGHGTGCPFRSFSAEPRESAEKECRLLRWPPDVGRAAVRARSAFRIGMARPRLVSLCLALALLALGDARVIRKEPDEQRLIGWLGEVPREASGGALGRKHGPRDAEYLANDANDSSDVLMRDVDEPTTVTLGHSSSSSNIHELDPSSFDLERDPRVERLSDLAARVLVPRVPDSGGVRPPRGGGRTAPHALHRGGRRGEDHRERRPDRRRPHEFRDVHPEGVRRDVSRYRAPRRDVRGFAVREPGTAAAFAVQRRAGVQGPQRRFNFPGERRQARRHRTDVPARTHEGGRDEFSDGHARAATRERNRIAFDKNELSKCAWRDGRGMAVQPRKGDAVLFFSFHRNEETSKFERQDPASTHASCPTSGGVKWTATKWIHERAFVTGVWSAPKCADTLVACEKWAKAGECAKNPGFMIGAETSGACVRSCCGDDDDAVAAPANLSAWQTEFCASCEGTSWPRRFAEMRANGGGGAVAVRGVAGATIRPPGRRWRLTKKSSAEGQM